MTGTERTAYMKKWRAANVEKRRAYVATQAKTHPWNKSFSERKNGARRRGIPFTITSDDLKQIWTGRCAITGLPFDTRSRPKGKTGPRPFSPSVDRINAKRGYIPGNIRFVLHCVNVFRGTVGDRLMRRVAELIINPEK